MVTISCPHHCLEQKIQRDGGEGAGDVYPEVGLDLHALPVAAADRRLFPRLESMSAEALGEHTLTVESCDNREREMREWLQKQIDARDARIRGLGEKIVKAMQKYRSLYPLETQDADASVEAAGEYRAMLTRLLADDLPRVFLLVRQKHGRRTALAEHRFDAVAHLARRTRLRRGGRDRR